jgi:hypothetical protein
MKKIVCSILTSGPGSDAESATTIPMKLQNLETSLI